MMEASKQKIIQCTRYEGIVCCIVARVYNEICPASTFDQELWRVVLHNNGIN